MPEKYQHESSFRDPSGFLFRENGTFLRQVNLSYLNHYQSLMNTGLYSALTNDGLLIPHTELDDHKGVTNEVYKVLKPEQLGFISYPYEWSFNMLKDAALATLSIQRISLEHGMTLKDSSAYNIQFHKGKPVFIDTLSFEKYTDGKPWEAYKQFCQHFLAPLALMSYTDIRLNQLLKIYMDGIPLDIASKLLPRKTRLSFSMLMHIHLHAKTQKKYEHKGSAARNVKITRANQLALIHGLSSTVKNLKFPGQKTEWGEYYTFTNYTDESFAKKKEIISGFLDKINPRTCWDLGANTGEFTRIASDRGVNCVAFDIDPLAVDTNYMLVKKNSTQNLIPLVQDLTNPSPSIGWSNNERMGFSDRPHPDVIFSLALIHHLAISNNLPLGKIAEFFSGLCEYLIIEFVPKQDSQVQKLLESRKDIFPQYTEEGFRDAFGEYFDIVVKENVVGSERTLFCLKRK